LRSNSNAASCICAVISGTLSAFKALPFVIPGKRRLENRSSTAPVGIVRKAWLRVVARNCVSLSAFKSAGVRAMDRVLPKLPSLSLDLSEGLLNLYM